ncbi:DSBA oxidoreductase [Bombiscardovia nodaiensis]|uniref:DSBA oxidoreductase n=1 Tax=Bombiscardovia nodaiensis TaxID=2932181 RepID=A0ABN6SCZ0_9BIFI|nr:DSBA oxidoreductase [Bombiscardovia nodaiensis]
MAEDSRGKAPAPRPQDRSGRSSQAHSRYSARLIALLALLLALAVAAGAWVVNRVSAPAAPTSRSSMAAAPAPFQPQASKAQYQALQAVEHKPSKANAQGTFVVCKNGVGTTIASVPTVEVYMDFLCGGCGELHQALDPTLIKMVRAGQINLGFNSMDFLDRLRQDQYSSRVASAVASVAQEDPDHFLDAVAHFFQKDIQPSESNPEPISNDQLAQELKSVGVPQKVAQQAASGEYIDWVQKLNAYTVTRSELRHPSGSQQGEMTTPTVLINNSYWDSDQVSARVGADGLPEALCQALGLPVKQVGVPSAVPQIGSRYRPLTQA